MKKITILVAGPADLDAVEKVERRCFVACRRSSRRAIQYSLSRPTQQVWLAWAHPSGEPRRVAGVMNLHLRRHSVRIYSLAVMPAFRGSGVGRRLVAKAVALAKRLGVRYVSLEADRRNRRLVQWYEGLGFDVAGVRLDYYSEGRDAVLMRRTLLPPKPGSNRASL